MKHQEAVPMLKALAIVKEVLMLRMYVSVWMLLALMICSITIGWVTHRPAPVIEQVESDQVASFANTGEEVDEAAGPSVIREVQDDEGILPTRVVPVLAGGMPKMPLLPSKEGPLTGIVVVIDPGHGGSDPGCQWEVRREWLNDSVTMYESSVTYPSSWQLAETMLDRGATVFLTAWDPEMVIRAADSLELPLPAEARFLDTEKRVEGGQFTPRWGTLSRAYKYWEKQEMERLAWISVHVDSLPGGISGAHVLCWSDSTDLGEPIAEEFTEAGLATPGRALWEKTQRLGILQPSKNSMRLRALIEFGVPGNDPGDSWRVRDVSSRQKLLDCVANGLEMAVK